MTVNGYTWRGSVARMGGEFLVGLNKPVRSAAAVEAGDEVKVELALDTEERTVEVAEALAAALAVDAKPKAAFDGLSYTHRKQYARWIGKSKEAGDARTSRHQGARTATGGQPTPLKRT